MIECGIIGANGYTGGELIRILEGHSKVSIGKLGSRSMEGQAVYKAHDWLYHKKELLFTNAETETFLDQDVVFLALPHGHSSKAARSLVAAGVKVIDLGADFRLNKHTDYTHWYESEHFWPEMISEVPYGLPELYRDRIQTADLVANPGCFPTAIILALAPLLKAGVIQNDFIVADAYTGVTGAGKNPTNSSHFPQMNENLWAYNIGKHRHSAEISQIYEKLLGGKVEVVFNPHLAPIDRGIHATITAALKKALTQKEVDALYYEFYQYAPFVRLRQTEHMVNVKAVRGSNYCDICPLVINKSKIVVSSAIDNLVKGAAGQAVQNMNLMMGFDQREGLLTSPLKP